jgi:hypothetical protein
VADRDDFGVVNELAEAVVAAASDPTQTGSPASLAQPGIRFPPDH